MTVLHIVPNLEPEICGVGSYAVALARALARLGLDSRFLVADPAWRPSEPAADPDWRPSEGVPPLAAASIGERTADALVRQLTKDGAKLVLLHYVNYSYARRGCPWWLVEGVTRWRRESDQIGSATADEPGKRLVTFFHEVQAFGPPWRSSFWTHFCQRSLAARLLRASDEAATGAALYSRILARSRQSPPVLEIPVLSPLGEPAVVPPPEQRQRTMLVHGGAGNRRRAYGELHDLLALACRSLGITKILDVGPPYPGQPEDVDGVPVEIKGRKLDRDVSAILLDSYAGFLGYPPVLLAKSTVFAAYCAHGLVPVCAWARRRPAREPQLEPPFWAVGAEPVPADPAKLAARAHAWYAAHDQAHQAAFFYDLFATPAAGAAAPLTATPPAAASWRPSTQPPESAPRQPPA
jgi:hypothetical protein